MARWAVVLASPLGFARQARPLVTPGARAPGLLRLLVLSFQPIHRTRPPANTLQPVSRLPSVYDFRLALIRPEASSIRFRCAPHSSGLRPVSPRRHIMMGPGAASAAGAGEERKP